MFANDFTIFANGIDRLRLFNNGSRTYDLSILAPSTALTATSQASVRTSLRPEANEITSLCGIPLEATSVAGRNWYDDDGNFITTSPSDICDNWQGVDDSTTNDTSYAIFAEGAGGLYRRARWRLSSSSYTPTTDTGYVIHQRVRYTDTGSPSGATSYKMTLYQGNPATDVSAKIIATESYTEADLTTSFADYNITVTPAEAALITDLTNLFLLPIVESNKDDASNFRQVEISQAYLEIPAAGAPSLAAGEYSYVYTYVRQATGAESGPSPALDYTHSTSGCIDLNDVAVSGDATVSHINIYRTPIGGGEYHLVTTIENAALANPTDGIEDCTQDVDLTDDNAIILDGARKRSYAALLPPRGRYLAGYKNRVFTAGAILDAPYTAGTASFTAGSTAVTGTNTYWSKRMEGRVIRVDGEPAVAPKSGFSPGGAVPPGLRDPSDVQTRVRERTRTYRIAEVTTPTSLTITQDFSEASGVWDYAIVDDRNPFQLSWSFPGHPEDWPVTFGVEIPGETGEGITGLVAHLGTLFIFTADSIHRLTGDDESNFRVDQMFSGTGCISGHTIKVVNNLVYFQGADGWYAYDGGVQPQHISSPPAQDTVLRGIDRTARSVSAARKRMSTAIYDDATDTLLTYNSLNGALEHDHAVAYDVKTGSWSVDDAPSVVSTGIVFDELGNKTNLVGDTLGAIWQLNMGNSDGAFEGTIVADITSVSGTTITCSGATFATAGNGLDGVPAYLLDPDGNLTKIKLLENTATTLSSLHLLPLIPTTDYRVVVGAIDFDVRTGRVGYGAPHKAKVLEYVEWVYEVTNQGELYCLVAEDNATPHYRTDIIELSDPKGVGRIFTRARGHHIQIGMRSFVPGHDVTIISAQHFLLASDEEQV